MLGAPDSDSEHYMIYMSYMVKKAAVPSVFRKIREQESGDRRQEAVISNP